MLDQSLRPFLSSQFFEPICRLIYRTINMHPNILTMISLGLGLLIVPVSIFGSVPWAVLCLWLSGLFDVLDGTHARLSHQVTLFGSCLDIVSDRVVESMAVLSIFMIDPGSRGGVCLGMMMGILCCVTSFLVVGALTPNQGEKGFHYSPGLIERAEAFLFFTAMLLVPKYFTILGWTFVFLMVLTMLIRLKEFYLFSCAASRD